MPGKQKTHCREILRQDGILTREAGWEGGFLGQRNKGGCGEAFQDPNHSSKRDLSGLYLTGIGQYPRLRSRVWDHGGGPSYPGWVSR